MSSFKRKGPIKQAPNYPGTRPSPASPSILITSTGIPSLDDILGGGIPLSCSLIIAAPDIHSSYGDLVQKYFTAQGLNCRHQLCVIDDNAEAFVKDIMWIPRDRHGATPEAVPEEDEKIRLTQGAQKTKIAWRYEQMKPFQTTVSASVSHSTDEYCSSFDLTSRVSPSTIEESLRSGQLSFIETHPPTTQRNSISEILCRITDILKFQHLELKSSHIPLRICVPSLGSPQWGDLTPQDILYFLHSLRALLRQNPHACASLSLAANVSTESWGGSGWLQKLGWVTDSALSLSAFSGDPSMTATFPNHHGLLHIHTLPAPHTIIPPSDKFSTLRGLCTSSGGTGGSGENNLTFKSTRKRLIFETLHLDIEGGVGERRTTPSSTTVELTSEAYHDHSSHVQQIVAPNKAAFATVEVAVEDSALQKEGLANFDAGEKVKDESGPKPQRQKKKVAFRADRPDLYDF